MALEAQEVAVRIKLIGGAAFKAEADESAASLERIGAAGKKVSSEGGIRAATGHVERLGNSVSKAGSKMIGAGRTLSMVGVPIAAIGYLAGKSAAQFNQAMTVLVTQANMPLKSLKKVSLQVQDMAAKFGSTPLEAAKAMYAIESIGLRGPKAMTALKASLMGTAVGLDQLSSTSDAVTTAMASHIKGVGGPVEAMAIMDKAVGLGKMHLQDLTDSFKSGIIPISQQFGLGFKQIVAAAAGLTRVGIPAAQVMSRMRLTLTSMIAPTAGGLAAMGQMGLSQFQLADDLRKPGGLLAALADLKSHAALLPRNVADADIAAMFGKSRGATGILSLLGHLGNIQGIYGQVLGANQSQFDKHFAETAKTPAFRYKQIEAAFEKVMIRFGTAVNQYVLPVLVKLIPVLTSVLKWFSGLSMGTKKLMLGILALSVVGGPILMFSGALLKLGGGVIAMIGKLATLGTATDAVAGVGEAGGLTAMAAGLEVVIPALAAFAIALGAYELFKHGHSPTTHQLDKATRKRGFTIGPHPTRLSDLSDNPLFQHNNYLHNQVGRRLRRSTGYNITHPLSPLQSPGMGFQQLGNLQNGYTPIHPVNPHAHGDRLSISPVGSDGFHIQADLTTNVNVDGKQLAQVVNTVNRKAQNRR